MSKKSQVDGAIGDLAARARLSDITLSAIADAAGVSLPTVRKIVGGKNGLPAYMAGLGVRPSIEDVETPERLRAAAKQVFAAHGYDRASLDDIAAAAGMTKGAVYHHFDSKAELFWALAEERLARQMAVADAATTEATSWDEATLQKVLSDVVQGAAADQDWARLHFEILSRTRDPDARKHFLKQERFILKRLAEMVSAAQKRGDARNDVAPEAIALTIAAVGERLLQYDMLKVTEPDMGTLLPDMVKVLMGGAAPPENP